MFTDTTNKIVIPENIAIQLANSSEVSIEHFFPDIYRRYQQYQQEQNAVQTSVRQKGRSGKGAKYNRRLHNPQKQRNKNTESIKVSTTEPNQPMFQPVSKEQLPFVDDEDAENDYDQSEASGTN